MVKQNYTKEKRKIAIWGTGVIAELVFSECQTIDNYNIVAVIDNNMSKVGHKWHERIITAPSILLEKVITHVVILSDSYEEIKRQIIEEYPQYSGKIENKNYFYKESLFKRYEKTKDEEIKRQIKYIEKNGLDIFNYPFARKYQTMNNKIEFDRECGLYYTFYRNHRMYFSRKIDSWEQANVYYNSILMEQDSHSPHRYLDDDFNVSMNDIVVDVGAAEGMFSLDVLEIASKIYIFEADKDWLYALEHTFSDYMHKVIIEDFFISSYSEGKYNTLDELIDEGDEVNFIKMDIEGNEWDALRGAYDTIRKTKRIKMSICCYHSDFDQILIERFMDDNDIKHTTTDGYMWYPYLGRQSYVSTSLNRAIIRGIK